MVAISLAGVRQKEKTEKILARILTDDTDFEFSTDQVKSTPVKRNEINVLDIYYRENEIRINIDPHSIQYSIYKDLYEKGIAYQKSRANM